MHLSNIEKYIKLKFFCINSIWAFSVAFHLNQLLNAFFCELGDTSGWKGFDILNIGSVCFCFSFSCWLTSRESAYRSWVLILLIEAD